MHAVVIPLYGGVPNDLEAWVQALKQEGLYVVLVQNNPSDLKEFPAEMAATQQGLHIVFNHNVGGVAGGFNRGVDVAIAKGADWITLLDQDSRLTPTDLQRLREPWQRLDQPALLVGPLIWDSRRNQLHAMASTDSLQG